jgi:hypothetical protein
LKSSGGPPGLPPGKIATIATRAKFSRAFLNDHANSAGLEAWLYVSQDGRRYSFQTRSKYRAPPPRHLGGYEF